MAKELSAGFDIAAVISEAAINKVYQISYWAGLLPTHGSTTFADATGEHALELSFLLPTLQFVDLANLQNAVKLRFPFLAQVPSKNAQGAGAVALFLTAQKETALDADNEEVEFVVLDFSTVPVSQLEFEPEPHPPLPNAMAHSFGVLAPGVVEDVAAPLAASILTSGLSKIPLTPNISSVFGFFTFRTYVDAGFSLPPDGTPYVLPRVLGAYVKFDSGHRDAPAQPPLQLRRQIVPNPHHYGYIWAGADEMKIALPAELIHARIGEALAAQGLSPLPAALPDDASVVINELDITLGDGCLVVTGNVTKVIEDGPDADVDFTLKITLAIENGTLQTTVIDKDIDLPWWADALPFLLPFLGSAILQSIQLTVAEETGSLGQFTGGLLSDVNVFSNQLPGIALAQAALTIHNEGDIEISPAGLVLPGQVEATLGETSIEQGFYVYGHLHSREFHRKGKGCPYLEKLKAKNTMLFLSPAAALSQGYNGCRFCYPDYDAGPAGRIILHFRDLASMPQPAKATVSLRFAMLQSVTIGDEEVKPQFDVQRSYSRHLEDDGVVYFDDFGLPDFLPGSWELKVEANGWTTTCALTVKKWAKVTGQDTIVAFTVGVDGCESAFGEMPEYPKP
jgi:hypothetical protein